MIRLTIALIAWIVYLQLLMQHLDAMLNFAQSGNGLAYAGGMVLLILGECASTLIGIVSAGADGIWIGPLLGIVASVTLESWFRSMGWF